MMILKPPLALMLVALVGSVAVRYSMATGRELGETDGPYAHLVMNTEPVAYWRLGDVAGNTARDRSGAGHHATVEPPATPGVAGRQDIGFCGPDVVNRGIRLAGGYLTADLPDVGDEYSVQLWFWNRRANDVRPVTGALFSRGPADAPAAAGDHVKIAGVREDSPGLLGFSNGEQLTTVSHGGPVIQAQRWYYLVFVRRGKQIQIFLNGATKPVVSGQAEITYPDGCGQFRFGASSDGRADLDGKLDEIAVYDRALSPGEIRMHFRQSNYPHTPSLADFRKMEQVLPLRATAEPRNARRVLILDRANGFYHPTIPLANRAIELMGERTGAFQTVLDHGYAMLTHELLAEFDAIVLNNTSNWQISDAQKKALLDFVTNGGGLMALHAATWNFADWPEGQQMLGGRLVGHPWHDAGTWAVKLDEPEHPLCRAFAGEGFWIHDEIYMFTVYSRQRLRVLLSLDMTQRANQVAGGREDNDHAISWIHQYGNGRVFYCSLGNNVAPFHDPRILQHQLDGLQWVLGDLPADATPSGKLSTPPEPALAPDR